MTAQKQLNAAEFFYEVLYPYVNINEPAKRVIAVLRRISETIEASDTFMLTSHCGQLFVEHFFPKQIPIRPAVKEYAAEWIRARDGVVVDETSVIIPVPRLPEDPLLHTQLRAVVCIRIHAITPLTIANPQNRSLYRRIGLHLGDLLTSAATVSIAHAHRRLNSLQSRLVLSTDICYQVAREIRDRILFDSSCCIFRTKGTACESVAVLPAKTYVNQKLTQGSGGGSGFAKRPVILDRDPNALLSETITAKETGGSFEAFIIPTPESSPLGLLRTPKGVRLTHDLSVDTLDVLRELVKQMDDSMTDTERSRVVCPLVWRRKILTKQELIGLLVVSSLNNCAFSTDEVLEICDIAAHSVPAMARDIAMESEFDLLERASVVDPEVPLLQNDSLQGLLRVLCERFRVHRNADMVVLIPYESRTGKMRLDMVASSPSTPDIGLVNPLPSEEGVLRKILEAGEFEWHRVKPSVSFGPESFVDTNHIQSFYAIALQSEAQADTEPDAAGEPLGVLFIDYMTPKRGAAKTAGGEREPGFSETERTWIRRYAAIAQQYLAAYARTAQSHKNDRALLNVYRQIFVDRSLESTLKAIFETGVELVGATAGVLAIPATDHNGLRILVAKNVDSAKIAPIPFGQGVTGTCALTKKPVLIVDSQKPETWPTGVRPLPWVPHSRSEFAVPIISADPAHELFGVLDVENQHSTNAFGPNERHALEGLANASVLAIQLTQSLAQLDKLEAIAVRIRRVSSVAQVFTIALEETAEVLGAYAGSVRALDPTQTYLEPVARVGARGLWADINILLGEGVTG